LSEGRRSEIERTEKSLLVGRKEKKKRNEGRKERRKEGRKKEKTREPSS
jgi:hypothetical protein